MTTVHSGQPSSVNEFIASRPPVELALLDKAGVIVAVNDAWVAFCRDNGGDIHRAGVGVSYLDVCDRADDVASQTLSASIRAAVAGDLPAPMVTSVACDAPGVPRMFDVLVSSRLSDDGDCLGATVSLSEIGRQERSPVTGYRNRPANPSGADTSGRDSHPDTLNQIADRERVARYLNDEVISELFSIGIGLQGMMDGLGREQETRLQGYVEALDSLIIQIRGAVFEVLSPADSRKTTFKRRVLEAIDEMSGLRLFTTEVAFAGRLNVDLTDEIRNAVLDVLRVAMSNVVLHSRASSVRISVSSDGTFVTVALVDDGQGMADVPWGGGLRRLSESAMRLGGELEVTATAQGGTALRWTAAVSDG